MFDVPKLADSDLANIQVGPVERAKTLWFDLFLAGGFSSLPRLLPDSF